MADKANEEVSASLAKARSATGIESPEPGSEDDTSQNDQPGNDEKPEDAPNKPKESEEESEEEEGEDDGDESEEGEEDTSSKNDNPPAKKRSPLNAAFAQIGELQKSMKDIVSVIADLKKAPAEKKEEAKAEVIISAKDVLQKMRDAGADADLIEELYAAIRTENQAEIKALIEPLKKELEDAKKSTDDLKAKDAEAARIKLERQTFGGEWSQVLPDIRKSYPNATDAMIAEAQKLMSSLAMSKEYGGESLDGKENKGKQPLPLDYILFKERKQFDNLLKVKSGRSGDSEGASEPGEPDEGDGDPDNDDLSFENMNPKKMKEHDKKKQKRMKPEPIEIIR